MTFLLASFFILLTIVVFIFAKWLYKRLYTLLLLTFTVATIIIILFLSLFTIDLDTYMVGGESTNQLLVPAVVALAYPLSQLTERLKRLLVPLVIGTFIGSIVCIASGLL